MGKMNHDTLFDSRVAGGCEPNCEFRKPGCQDYCRVNLLAKKKREEKKEMIRKERNRLRILNTQPKPDRNR